MDSDRGRRFGARTWGWLTLLVAVLWAVLRVAPGTIPDVATQALRSASWPQKDLPEFSAFVRTSPTGQIAYQLIGERGTWEYVVLHAVTAAIAVTLLAVWLQRRVPTEHIWTARRLVVLSPVSAVLIIFLGSYDPFTVLGTVALLFAWTSGRRFWIIAAGTYLGFQHFEQGLIVVTVTAIAAMAVRGDNWCQGARSTPAWGFLGLAAGKIILALTLWVATGDAVSGRGSFVIWEKLRPALVSGLNFGPVLLLSLFAGAWAVVIVALLQRSHRSRVLFASALVVCLVPMAIAADHTRIYILCSLPVLMIMTAGVLASHSTTTREVRTLEALAWVVTPIFIWQASEGFGYVQHTGVLDLYVMFSQQWEAWLG